MYYVLIHRVVVGRGVCAPLFAAAACLFFSSLAGRSGRRSVRHFHSHANWQLQQLISGGSRLSFVCEVPMEVARVPGLLFLCYYCIRKKAGAESQEIPSIQLSGAAARMFNLVATYGARCVCVCAILVPPKKKSFPPRARVRSERKDPPRLFNQD